MKNVKNKREIDYHAKLVIHDLPNLSLKTRKLAKKWLEKAALEIVYEDPKIFAKTYTLRLMK